MKFCKGRLYVVKFLDHIHFESFEGNKPKIHPTLMFSGFYRGEDEKYIILESLCRDLSDPTFVNYDDRNQVMQIIKSTIVFAEEYIPKKQ